MAAHVSEPTYDDERARRLVELLRGLARRINELEGDAALLAAGPELLHWMGDARSELFQYEVRATFPTPQELESRRIVEQAREQTERFERGTDFDDEEDQEPWRGE
jgi:hypothetical protein